MPSLPIPSFANINAALYPGEVVYLRSHNGAVNYVSSGNISLGSRSSPMSVAQNNVAAFVRMDLGTTWQLVSVTA